MWRDLIYGINEVSIYGPWMVVEDFNIIREDLKLLGGNPRPLAPMGNFNECLDSYGLLDLLVAGRRMSWCNGHDGSMRSWARLDWSLINSSFGNSYSTTYFEYLQRKCSDHSPMVVRFQKMEVLYGSHPFCLQNMWCNQAGFKPYVEAIWPEPIISSGLHKLAEKLKKVKIAPRPWNRNIFGMLVRLSKS